MRTGGFTLVEMLVALAIFALIAAAGVGLLRSSVDTQAVVTGGLDRTRAAERLRMLLAADMAQAVDRPVREAGGQAPSFLGRSNELRLVRAGLDPIDEAPTAGVRRVRWSSGGGELRRTQYDALDSDEDSTAAAVARDVTGARFRYRRRDGGWIESWPLGGEPPLPLAVELTIERSGSPAMRIIAALPPPPPPAAA